MFNQCGKAKLTLTLAVIVGLGITGLTRAGDRFSNRRIPTGGAPFLVPDDPASVVTVDLPDGESVRLRVVSTPELPLASLISPGAIDPSAPERLATTIETPSGAIVNINIVEFGLVKATRQISRRDRGSAARWVVNNELPFTAESEVQASQEGRSIRVAGTDSATGDAVDYVTGAPIVELFVLYNPSAPRLRAVNYAVLLADDAQGTPTTSAATSGNGTEPNNGDGGASGGSGNGLDSEAWQPPDNEGDGADPIGSPDRIPPG